MCVFLLWFLEDKKLRFGVVHSVGFKITVSLHFLFVLSYYLFSLLIFLGIMAYCFFNWTVHALGAHKNIRARWHTTQIQINLVAIINHEHINDIVDSCSLNFFVLVVTVPSQVSSGSTSTRSSYSDVMTQTESILGSNGRIWRWWCSMFSS